MVLSQFLKFLFLSYVYILLMAPITVGKKKAPPVTLALIAVGLF